MGEGYINPFMVLNELEKGLAHHSLITDDDSARSATRVHRHGEARVRRDRQERGPARDQRRRGGDQPLAANYIDNVKAYTLKEKVKNRYTGKDEEPDERLMRSIEEKIDIPESRKDDFRREIMNYIGALAIEGKKFTYDTNDRLRRALELKLFEDQKDSIKLSSFVSNVIDKETQDKIDVIKDRLIKYYGYNEASAKDVLSYVASIFARGDVRK
jgi:serine protein kinase